MQAKLVLAFAFLALQPFTSTTCSNAPSCASYQNTGGGAGVVGISAYGAGVVAQSHASRNGNLAALTVSNPSGDQILSSSGAPGAPSKHYFKVTFNDDVVLTGFVHHVSGGVDSYAAMNASPTIEVDGEARLVAGRVYVRLTPAFGAAIDGRTTYLVFITPESDTRGLYVTARTKQGFVVSETQQGRGSVPFAYRVVARPMEDRAGD